MTEATKAIISEKLLSKRCVIPALAIWSIGTIVEAVPAVALVGCALITGIAATVVVMEFLRYARNKV